MIRFSTEPWFDVLQSPEGNVVFIMSLAQLVVAGIMSNRSTPFRRAAITNPLLIIALTAQVSFVVALLCLPGGPDCWFTWEFAELVAMPLSVRVRLGVAILAYAASELFADWAIRKLLRCCPVPKENLYEQKLT